MPKKKDGRASWFKVFLHQKPMLDAIPDEKVGSALKAALSYFDTGEIPELDPMAYVAFSAFKPYIDESNNDFKKYSEAGQRGNQKRWNNQASPPDTSQSLPDTSQSLPDTPYHEAEALSRSTKHYAEAEAEAHSKVTADKPPSRTRFSPPSVEEVQDYCFEKGLSMDARRFVDYYESNGWMVGRNKMKDWKAAARGWEARDKTQKPSNGGYVHGADRLAEMLRNGEFDD